MLFFSLNVVLMHFSMGMKNHRLLMIAAVLTLAEVAGIVLAHATLYQVILVLLVGNLLILAISLPWLYFSSARGAGHLRQG